MCKLCLHLVKVGISKQEKKSATGDNQCNKTPRSQTESEAFKVSMFAFLVVSRIPDIQQCSVFSLIETETYISYLKIGIKSRFLLVIRGFRF